MAEPRQTRLATLLDRDWAQTPTRAALSDGGGRRYLWSYLLQRFVVGAVGLALPVVLMVGAYAQTQEFQRSLSAYYYTGLRDVFVGGLVTIGVFLLTYMVFEKNLDNAASLVAGAAVIVVAWAPTGPPAGGDDSIRVVVHFVAAFVFIAALAVLSVRFGWAEGRRSDRDPAQHRWWSLFHYACAAVIAAAVVFIGITKWSGVGEEYSLLIGETLAVLAFGASWAAKGSELAGQLLGRRG